LNSFDRKETNRNILDIFGARGIMDLFKPQLPGRWLKTKTNNELKNPFENRKEFFFYFATCSTSPPR